jgi:hypothetical protein
MSPMSEEMEEIQVDGQIIKIPTAGEWGEIARQSTFMDVPVRLLGGKGVGSHLMTFVTDHQCEFSVGLYQPGAMRPSVAPDINWIVEMSGHILHENVDLLRREALSLGKLHSEEFKVDGPESADKLDLIAGLYVRAMLYLDAKSPSVVANG